MARRKRDASVERGGGWAEAPLPRANRPRTGLWARQRAGVSSLLICCSARSGYLPGFFQYQRRVVFAGFRIRWNRFSLHDAAPPLHNERRGAGGPAARVRPEGAVDSGQPRHRAVGSRAARARAGVGLTFRTRVRMRARVPWDSTPPAAVQHPTDEEGVVPGG